jgi:thiamine-phosphate pyrophosphorylase
MDRAPPLDQAFRLVVITDREAAGLRGVEGVVAAALRGGARCIQLREKLLGAGETLPLAHRLRLLTRAAGALFIVNDRVDLALASEADGVHLGPDDLPVGAVRGMVPPGFLVGYSTDDPDVARRAVEEGADYLGCGTVWPTDSKADAGGAIGPEGLARVAGAVSVPVVAIGGITPERARLLRGTGAAGVAVIRSVMAAPDPEATVRALLEAGPGSGGPPAPS